MPFHRRFTLLAALLILADWAQAQTPVVVVPRSASALETLAAREVSRTLYLRTGELPVVTAKGRTARGDSIVIGRKDRVSLGQNPAVAALKPQNFLLQTVVGTGGRRTYFIVGGDDIGVLYGAYRFAERLGVRFYLHGDVVPDGRLSTLPLINERGAPLFEIRGIQPFHDFPEGPDWWNRDDYLATISQLPKLRMNFIGLHCYPEGSAGPEPAVWIGQRGDFDEKGRVSFSYPSRWANTAIPARWAYAGMKTSEFSGGAAALFEADDFGPDVMRGMLPSPQTPQQSNRLFNNAGELLGDAFSHARALGVKTAIGTETPLIIPREVRERLVQNGKNPQDPEVVREIYRGIFERIVRTHPLDYYWLWTPENWIWGGNKPGQFEAATQDIGLALEALKASGGPFTLATSGWVLGPQGDRAALDRFLPPSSPLSSINQFHSHGALDPALANVVGRPKWAMPWLENDRSMVSPQPWVGRLRYDAADARRLGATGLIGLHWRTYAIAPNIAALAHAAWDQSYVPASFDTTPIPPRVIPIIGAVGGENVLGTDPVAGTTIDPIYQSVRVNMKAYNFEIPNGTYRVTLQFNEATFGEAGKRVFGVKIQGQTALENLDIFARAGQNTALDIPISDVRVSDGLMKIEFVPQVEAPLIAAIVIEGSGDSAPFVRKINSAGGAYAGYEPERPREAPLAQQNRALPSADFYLDFARANFGAEVASEASALLTQVDGMAMPLTSEWNPGPGGLIIQNQPWQELKSRFAWVEEWAALRPRVRGAGNRARFDAWRDTFRATAAMAQVGSARGQLDAAMAALKTQGDVAKRPELAARALALRLELARKWAAMMSLHVAAAQTTGEMGTLTNLEQHSRRFLRFISAHDEALTLALGRSLPAEAQPSQRYRGEPRILMPTARSLVAPHESLSLKVILLGPETGKWNKASLLWRPLQTGEKQGPFRRVPLSHVARSVYRAVLPPQKENSTVEYFLEADFAGRTLVYPASAPALNRTVVVWRAGNGAQEIRP